MNAVFSRQDHQIDRLLNLHEVTHLTALSRATVYRAIASGDFPAPVKIGRVSRWPASEVSDFLSALVASRTTKSPSTCSGSVNEEKR
ncbi:helix-turn-helix transcriptional regulator [Paracoccus sp. 08]|uniref:helix-turn-helix transcriptional regulator n=1 Tax=Paracoccus sp. 08 TaxID=2606624 RepID=UPI0033802FEB|nr:AlpA family phage regulatory protein [Paracoccus sp. 08]